MSLFLTKVCSVIFLVVLLLKALEQTLKLLFITQVFQTLIISKSFIYGLGPAASDLKINQSLFLP